MFIPSDSPLRKVPTSLDRKTVLFLDGIRYSVHIFELASLRLARTLDGLSRANVDSNDIAIAMADAWTMIDSTHRLRELLQHLPGLRKKELGLQLFLRRTSTVEDLRNFFQHFRTEINSFTERGLPLWGTLSWAYFDKETGELQHHTIAPGTFFGGVELASCTFDSLNRRFMERVLFQAGSKTVDLADLNDWVAEFAAWYSAWFRLQFSDTDCHGSDMHIKIRIHSISNVPPKRESELDRQNEPPDGSDITPTAPRL